MFPKNKKIKKSKNNKNYIHNSSITFVKNMQIFHKPADNKETNVHLYKEASMLWLQFCRPKQEDILPSHFPENLL